MNLPEIAADLPTWRGVTIWESYCRVRYWNAWGIRPSIGANQEGRDMQPLLSASLYGPSSCGGQPASNDQRSSSDNLRTVIVR